MLWILGQVPGFAQAAMQVAQCKTTTCQVPPGPRAQFEEFQRGPEAL